MKQLLRSVPVLVCGNAIGIMVAALYLGPGFRLGIVSFVLAVLTFTAIEAAALPLLERASRRWAPHLLGGLSFFAVFVGLVATNFVIRDKAISGLGNWLAATLIVWLVSLAAQFVFARFVFKVPMPGATQTRAP